MEYIKKFYLLALIASLGLSACSNANAKTNNPIKASADINDQDQMQDDLEVVDFMDENFDMSKIEQRSCCDE